MNDFNILVTAVSEDATKTNARRCPVCGSDMKLNKDSNVHDKYSGTYTCCNHDCNIETVIRN